METYEYHQLLKHLYFEGYVDSYKEAEDLIEELTDEEFDFLYEEVFGIDEGINQKGEFVRDTPSTSPSQTKDSLASIHSLRRPSTDHDAAKRRREELAKTLNPNGSVNTDTSQRPGESPEERRKRIAQSLLNPSSQKESYELILNYLLDEGYADDLNSAEQILENMSEGWKSDVLKATKKIAKKVGKTKVAKRAKKFVTRTALGVIGIPLIS